MWPQVIKDLKKRKIYIRGKLFIKCAERGLTDPFKGGNVKLKTFMDSLKHACKVPNTDQPYACVDMMVVGVVLDKVLGLHQSSLLLTPHQVNSSPFWQELLSAAGFWDDWWLACCSSSSHLPVCWTLEVTKNPHVCWFSKFNWYSIWNEN